MIELPSGLASPLLDLDRVGCRDRTQVIVIAGQNDSGKTTLLAELYSAFLRGTLEEFAFAGSSTLLGFEERCKFSRTSSDQAEANMPRTALLESDKFLHLRLARTDRSDITRSLLFTDWAGEKFRQMRDSVDECRAEMSTIKPAVVVVTADGARLSVSKERHDAKADAQMTLQALSQTDDAKRLRVVLLTTKWDLVEPDPAAARFAESTERDLRTRFAGTFGDYRSHRVAAKLASDPRRNASSQLASLLRTLTSPVGPSLPEMVPSERWYERFGLPRSAFGGDTER